MYEHNKILHWRKLSQTICLRWDAHFVDKLQKSKTTIRLTRLGSTNSPTAKRRNCTASVNSSCAQPLPPGLLGGICPPCQSRGSGICKFCTARGPGICQPRGYSRAFDTHAVSYQNIITQKVLLEKKQIGSSVKGRNKYWRGLILCMHFFIASLHSENRSYRCESTFFGYWIKFLLILFEEHPFIFIKLFITYKVTAPY